MGSFYAISELMAHIPSVDPAAQQEAKQSSLDCLFGRPDAHDQEYIHWLGPPDLQRPWGTQGRAEQPGCGTLGNVRAAKY